MEWSPPLRRHSTVDGGVIFLGSMCQSAAIGVLVHRQFCLEEQGFIAFVAGNKKRDSPWCGSHEITVSWKKMNRGCVKYKPQPLFCESSTGCLSLSKRYRQTEYMVTLMELRCGTGTKAKCSFFHQKKKKSL